MAQASSDNVVVIGAGVGGLSAALTLSARGVPVTVLELGARPGGKMGCEVVEGVTFDTGPSLLTMPYVLRALLASSGHDFDEHLTLRRLDPAFHYVYPDGVELMVHHRLEDTLSSVRETLGAAAADELSAFVRYAGRIWAASAPSFVFGDAPSLGAVMAMGPSAWLSLRHIDAMRTMWQAICARVRSPHLRTLLARYATYNGSDVRRAPATLNCIVHVELVEGGYGVEGGMHRVAEVLRDLCEAQGVRFEWQTAAERLRLDGRRVVGVETRDGRLLGARAVVSNVDSRHLTRSLLPSSGRAAERPAASMSAWNAVIRAGGRPKAPHTVFFPERYEEEFIDIFDRRRTPQTPTLYLCDQSQAHGRSGWSDGTSPLFVMLNAPALSHDEALALDWSDTRAEVMGALRRRGVIQAADSIVWERSPWSLSQRFPGSLGSLYGAASNSMWSAFKRPPNRWSGLDGLYLASGSAHPGGGVPLCLLSGMAASRALVEDLGIAPGELATPRVMTPGRSQERVPVASMERR